MREYKMGDRVGFRMFATSVIPATILSIGLCPYYGYVYNPNKLYAHVRFEFYEQPALWWEPLEDLLELVECTSSNEESG